MSDKKNTPPSFNPAANVLFGNATLEDILHRTVLTSTQLNAIAVDDEPSNAMADNFSDTNDRCDTQQ